MAIVDIIYIVKPENPRVLHGSEHLLNFFQRFCASQGVQMQFELIHESFLVFWKTFEDYEKMHELLAHFPMEKVKNFSPNTELERWDVKIIWKAPIPMQEAISRLTKKTEIFLRNCGRVDIKEGGFTLYMPTNFNASIYLNEVDLGAKF